MFDKYHDFTSFWDAGRRNILASTCLDRSTYNVSWEPEGRYCNSEMFHWEPEGRYCCTKCMAIAPFCMVLNGTYLICNNALLALKLTINTVTYVLVQPSHLLTSICTKITQYLSKVSLLLSAVYKMRVGVDPVGIPGLTLISGIWLQLYINRWPLKQLLKLLEIGCGESKFDTDWRGLRIIGVAESGGGGGGGGITPHEWFFFFLSKVCRCI